jgi:hypothetical protein
MADIFIIFLIKLMEKKMFNAADSIQEGVFLRRKIFNYKILFGVIALFIFNSSFLVPECLSQWALDTNGLGNISVLSMAYSGSNIYAGTHINTGVYKSTDNGTTWIHTPLNNLSVFSLAVNGSNIYAGTYGTGVYISTNDGVSWTQSTLNNQYVISLAANAGYIFAGTYYNGVYMSTNNGSTWTQTSLNNRDVYSLMINGSNIFAGTLLNGVYISTNNGSSWTQTSLNNQTIYCFAISGSNIFAGAYSSAGIYLSTNNGSTWSQTSLNNRSINSLIVSGSNNIIAGSDGYGVYLSTNNGANWVLKNDGFVNPNLRAYSLCIFNNYIFAGTDYSAYRRLLSEVIGINPISNEIPAKFSLSQNYPNPFNPVTKIKFSLPKSSYVKIFVYDALGRVIDKLVNEQLNAGTYEVDWNAEKYSSGIYYYKLSAGDYSETMKMILLK